MHTCTHTFLERSTPCRHRPAPAPPSGPEQTHANQRDGDPSQCFFTERRTASEQGQGHHLHGEKDNINFSSMVTSVPLENTLPLTGGAGPKRPQAHSTGGRGQGQARPPRKTGKATSPSKKTTHLTGIGAGGAALHHICVYILEKPSKPPERER